MAKPEAFITTENQAFLNGLDLPSLIHKLELLTHTNLNQETFNWAGVVIDCANSESPSPSIILATEDQSLLIVLEADDPQPYLLEQARAMLIPLSHTDELQPEKYLLAYARGHKDTPPIDHEWVSLAQIAINPQESEITITTNNQHMYLESHQNGVLTISSKHNQPILRPEGIAVEIY